MKKIALIAGMALLSTKTLAGIGLDVELGYQSGTVSPSYADSWSEQFGDGEPSGYAANVTWQVIGVPGLYLGLDYADQEDKEDHYNDEITRTDKRTAFEVGYQYSVTDTARLVAALNYADRSWEYEWDYGATTDSYEADADGVSLVLGAEKDVSDEVVIGTRFTGGFETGAEVYTALHLVAGLSVKASYGQTQYESDDWGYYNNGSAGTPSSDNNDGDIEFDNQVMRVSAVYSF